MPDEVNPDELVDTPDPEPVDEADADDVADPDTGCESGGRADEPDPEPVETPEQIQARVMDELFPYPRDAEFHRLAFLFFNMPFLKVSAETAHALAAWVFDSLDCSGPGVDAKVKYDALGGSGAPHETGRWIKRDAERVAVEVTTPDVVLTGKSEAELAQILIDAEAALNAHRARTAKGV